MNIYQVNFENKALADIKKITNSGKKADIHMLNQILEELKTHPASGTGKPEQLKNNLSGCWSRRINKKDRMIYQIIEEPNKKVIVVAALGHY